MNHTKNVKAARKYDPWKVGERAHYSLRLAEEHVTNLLAYIDELERFIYEPLDDTQPRPLKTGKTSKVYVENVGWVEQPEQKGQSDE